MVGKREERLLEDKDVRRWFENMSRGAQSTADNYLRCVGRFSERTEIAPRELVKMPKKKREDLIHDYVTEREGEGKAGSFIESELKAVKSWLSWNDVSLGRKIKVKGTKSTPTLAEERVPDREGLRRTLNAADPRARVAVSLVAFSGLRIQALGNYEGNDGLRIGDFPEMVVKPDGVTFKGVPTMVVVRPELSKTQHQYLTFLGPEGCSYLQAYLKNRMAGGEDLNKASPIITPKRAKKDFITSINVGDIIRKAMRAAGDKNRPYVLRSYFDTRCMQAESKGLLRDFRVFWMGHTGDIEHKYTLNKGRLPEDLIEQMRHAYESALEYLETAPTEREGDPTLKLLRVFLQAAGYTEEQIEAMQLEAKSEEEIVLLLQDAPKRLMANGGDPRQRIVSIEDLPSFLDDGWIYKSTLPDNRIIIELSLT
jgi:integrase